MLLKMDDLSTNVDAGLLHKAFTDPQAALMLFKEAHGKVSKIRELLQLFMQGKICRTSLYPFPLVHEHANSSSKGLLNLVKNGLLTYDGQERNAYSDGLLQRGYISGSLVLKNKDVINDFCEKLASLLCCYALRSNDTCYIRSFGQRNEEFIKTITLKKGEHISDHMDFIWVTYCPIDGYTTCVSVDDNPYELESDTPDTVIVDLTVWDPIWPNAENENKLRPIEKRLSEVLLDFQDNISLS
jgi:hypothetical protein